MNKKFIIIDTETANGLEDPIMYDFGYAIIDRFGKVYENGSFVIADTFFDKELMSTAYYNDKIQNYIMDINSGFRKLITLKDLRQHINKVMYSNNVTQVIAHNARFDYSSTTKTQRYITSSKYRYFFPYGTQFIDTLKMARKALKDNDNYRQFCIDNGYVTSRNCLRYTAEILYRYITNDNDFVESHTGYEDVLIEKEIFAYCMTILDSEEEGLLW